VLVGEEDTMSPPTEAQALLDLLPAASLVRIPRAGHLSAVEDPEAFTTALRAFVVGLGQPADG